MKFSKNQKIAGIAIFAIILLLITSDSLSILSMSIVNDKWQILSATSNYGDQLDVIPAGTIAGDKVLTSDLRITMNYEKPTIFTTYQKNSGKVIRCWSINILDIPNQLKTTTLSVYDYTNNAVEVEHFSQIDITSGGSSIFSKRVDISSEYQPLVNGISIEPQFTAYQKFVPAISYASTYAIYDSSTNKVYVLKDADMNALAQAASGTAGKLFGQTVNNVNYCPGGGVTQFYSTIRTFLENNYDASGSIPGSVGLLDYQNRQFDPNTGKLSIPATAYVKTIFTIEIPNQVGSKVIWTPLITKPRIVLPSASVNIDLQTPIKIQVCNDASITGDINLRTEVTGAIVHNGAATVNVLANGCTDFTFYVSQTTQGNIQTLPMKIIASSRENIDTKTINLITKESVIPDICILHPEQCDACILNPASCDICVKYPDACDDICPAGQHLEALKCVDDGNGGGNNQTACMPLIQKSVTSFPTPILGWFGLGSSVTNCVWDYVGIGALIVAFGVLTFFYGENKDKPDTKKLGTAAMILGVCLIVGMTFFESTVLSYFGGNGILLIIVLIVALYVAIKGII